VHRKNILIYVQQDSTLHSLFYLETALHVSGGTSTHHQERCEANQVARATQYISSLTIPEEFYLKILSLSIFTYK
jgi:hypothetical protein